MTDETIVILPAGTTVTMNEDDDRELGVTIARDDLATYRRGTVAEPGPDDLTEAMTAGICCFGEPDAHAPGELVLVVWHDDDRERREWVLNEEVVRYQVTD